MLGITLNLRNLLYLIVIIAMCAAISGLQFAMFGYEAMRNWNYFSGIAAAFYLFIIDLRIASIYHQELTTWLELGVEREKAKQLVFNYIKEILKKEKQR